MIPKIIHYCWFGPNKISDKAQMCIDSWKTFFPDFEIMFWNEENSPIHNGFAKQAYEAKKYAFVADYVRTWALNKYGGVYFDTDVLVIKDFGDLLSSDGFLAYEQKEKLYCNVAVWGSAKGSILSSMLLEFYDNSNFDVNNIFALTIPNSITKIIKENDIREDLRVLEYDVFYPFPQKKRRSGNYMKYVTQNTLAIHLWDFSWLTLSERIKEHWRMLVRYVNSLSK